MPIFRKNIPKRRKVSKNVKSYKSHRKKLVADFNHRCGYCDCIDSFRRISYEIDHFIPKAYLKKVFLSLKEYELEEQRYSNLVYSCQSCNNAKGENWPSNSMVNSYINNIGFIDPCNPEYDNQFSRNENGEIIPQTKLGKWIHDTLNLEKPEHSIIWHLEQLDMTIKEIKNIPKKNKKPQLKLKLNKLCLQYYEYDARLREYNSNDK